MIHLDSIRRHGSMGGEYLFLEVHFLSIFSNSFENHIILLRMNTLQKIVCPQCKGVVMSTDGGVVYTVYTLSQLLQ